MALDNQIAIYLSHEPHITWSQQMLIIEKYSHFIKIAQPEPEFIPYLKQLSKFYTQKSFNQDPRKSTNDKVFCGITADDNYHFHVNQLPHLLSILYKAGYNKSQITIIHNQPIENIPQLNAPLQSQWQPRDYQVPAIDYLVAEDEVNSKLLTLRTGEGKTFTSLAAISKLNQRTAVVILPSYIEKWCSDITKTLQIHPHDIMVVQGSYHLKGLISLALDNNLTSKFIVISTRTLQNYIQQYEQDPVTTIEEYQISPDKLYTILKVGTLLIDETHQHIHAVFKILLYTHVNRLIALTATLISDHYVVERIHNIMYPPDTRFNNPTLERYIQVFAIPYTTTSIHPSKLRTTEWGSNVYSHNAYEKYILQRPFLLNNYLNIITHLVDYAYISQYLPNDKLAIYASTVAMCDTLCSVLKSIYPDKDIRRYCEDDPYENAIDPDIRITTIISSGTALDIPNLRVVILTNSIASSVSNLQVVGRLRKLSDRDVRFYYLYNENIPKQVSYHYRKVDLLVSKVLSIKNLKSPVTL